VVSVLGSCAADPRSSPPASAVFFYHVYNGYGDHNISLTFKFLDFVFVFFLLLLTFKKNGYLTTHNILARKSEGGILPYCKIGANSVVYNRPGPLVRHK
jgi:hypothetical protein